MTKAKIKLLSSTVFLILMLIVGYTYFAPAVFRHLSSVTEIIYYAPPQTLPDAVQSGSCFANSIADPYRADAWRCTVGNEIYDPCFETSKSGTLLCGMNPLKDYPGFQLKLLSPLPNASAPKATSNNWGWLVVLSDGTYCTPFTGTRPFSSSGQVAYYSCKAAKPGENMIFGDLNNKNSDFWTAKVGSLAKSGSFPPSVENESDVMVSKVWQ